MMMRAMIRAGEGTRTPESEISASSSVCRSAPPTPPAPAPPTASRSCDWQEQCHSPQPRTNERRAPLEPNGAGRKRTTVNQFQALAHPYLLRRARSPRLPYSADSPPLVLCLCAAVVSSLARSLSVCVFVRSCACACPTAPELVGCSVVPSLTRSLSLSWLSLRRTRRVPVPSANQPTNARPSLAPSRTPTLDASLLHHGATTRQEDRPELPKARSR